MILTRYLKEYEDEGIPIWSLSLQNECQNNPPWECCYWPIDETITFISDYLGPSLDENGLSNVKLLIWDWDKVEGEIGRGDGIITYTKSVLNSKAKKYVDAIGFHWYDFSLKDVLFTHNSTWATEESFENVKKIKSMFPNYHLVATEGCDIADADPIQIANRYIYDIINDFKVGTEGWIDWNMVLDSNGGPVHKNPSFRHAPIMVNIQQQEIVYNLCIKAF